MSWVYRCDECQKVSDDHWPHGWTEARMDGLQLTFNLKRRERAPEVPPLSGLAQVFVPPGWGIFGSEFSTPSSGTKVSFREVRHFCSQECLLKTLAALTTPDPDPELAKQ